MALLTKLASLVNTSIVNACSSLKSVQFTTGKNVIKVLIDQCINSTDSNISSLLYQIISSICRSNTVDKGVFAYLHTMVRNDPREDICEICLKALSSMIPIKNLEGFSDFVCFPIGSYLEIKFDDFKFDKVQSVNRNSHSKQRSIWIKGQKAHQSY